MFSNLYPLSNTRFINLGRAQFLCDLITGVQIDICAYIFQTIGKTAARMCLPFCSLLMKTMKHEGVRPPKEGKIIVCHRLISIASLQKSKSQSSAKRKKQDLSSKPKSKSTHTTPRHTNTTSPPIPQTIRFKCVLLLLRHSQMRFNASQRRAFSYSCQKGGEQSLCIDYIDWTIAYSKGESITRRKVCIVKGGVL